MNANDLCNDLSLQWKPDLVLNNATIIDVFNQKFYTSDLAIKGNRILGIGRYNSDNSIDCSGKYVCPGFIDSHVHIESSMVAPAEFGRCVIQRGVTSVIADPHEIVNVMGYKGMDFMLEDSKKSPIDIYFMLPSCVPATEFEDSGAVFSDKEMIPYLADPRVIGLGEVMDVPSVVYKKPDMHKKLLLFHNKIIDGHCPNISNDWIDKYIYNGIYTDHECTSTEEVLTKVRKGMYIAIREGTAAKNLSSLVDAVDSNNYSRFMFCTDDRHITDLVNEGSIDFCIKKGISLGLNPIQAITMATLNTAQCYGLKRKGALAPGYAADIVILSDLKNVVIEQVIKDGRLLSGKSERNTVHNFMNSIKLEKIEKECFKITADGTKMNIIKLIENSLETIRIKGNAIIKDSEVIGVNGKGINKIAVFERHKNTGKKYVGFVEGFGLKDCALAQTIAHDSHNIVVIGDNDADMAFAVNKLREVGGGIALVSKEKIIDCLSLPIGGLMTYESYDSVVEELQNMLDNLRTFTSCNSFDPIVTLAFLSLPVIPEIRITARGLFYFPEYKFINLFE